MAVFSPIFVADTKITFIYNFAAPLKFSFPAFWFTKFLSHYFFLYSRNAKFLKPRSDKSAITPIEKHFKLYITFRSSRLEVFCKKDVLENLAKFAVKHLCQRLFFSRAAGLRPVTLLKKSLWHRCFPVNFVKFLRTPFFIEYLWCLLLLFCLRLCAWCLLLLFVWRYVKSFYVISK